MALITIYKGNKSLTIPSGSYSRQYAPAGWSLTKPVKEVPNEKDLIQIEKGDEEPTGDDIVDENPDDDLNDDLNDDDSEDDFDEDEDVEYVDPEDLAKRQISTLDKDELEILAEYKGLDISKLTTIKKLKEALKGLE